VNTRLIINVVAVCGTAIFTGVLLNIGITLGSYWKSLPPAEFLDWFERNSHFVSRAIPFALVPTVLGLAGSLWAGWADGPQRMLWGSALACMVVLLAITAIFNGPLNSQFASKTMASDGVPAALDTWLIAHTARITLGIVASVLGAVAISR